VVEWVSEWMAEWHWGIALRAGFVSDAGLPKLGQEIGRSVSGLVLRRVGCFVWVTNHDDMPTVGAMPR
jgi:hypothetical protein